MSRDQERSQKAYKTQKAQFEETKQASEPDMSGMLKLSNREFNRNMVYVQKNLMDKVNGM